MLQITNLACVNNLTGNYIYTCEKSAEKFEKLTCIRHTEQKQKAEKERNKQTRNKPKNKNMTGRNQNKAK